jgi:hypothetical protein
MSIVIRSKLKLKCDFCGKKIKKSFIFWSMNTCDLHLHHQCATYLGVRLIGDANDIKPCVTTGEIPAPFDRGNPK